MTRYLSHFCGLIALLLIVVSCDDPSTHTRNQWAANAGLANTLALLPEVSNLEQVKVLTYESQHENDKGATCYYATGYVILGTPTSELDASTIYIMSLKQAGWVLEESQSRVLAHGSNERIVVEYGPRSDGLEKIADEAKARENYRGVVIIRVVYIFPTRKEC